MDNFRDQFFNPEDTAKMILMKSYLPKRQDKRQTGTGSEFFQDNRIRSCSYVKETKKGLKAIPYYDKRNDKIYPTYSTSKKSWTSETHGNHGGQNAGMGNKKHLVKYDPKSQRNLMGISDFKPPYPNSSHIEIGARTQRDTKHYQTTYRNDMLRGHKQIQTSNPAIQAFKNKWLRSRLQK